MENIHFVVELKLNDLETDILLEECDKEGLTPSQMVQKIVSEKIDQLGFHQAREYCLWRALVGF